MITNTLKSLKIPQTWPGLRRKKSSAECCTLSSRALGMLTRKAEQNTRKIDTENAI